ncbi:recombinase family protein [Dysosmobacter sp.]
MDFFDCYGYGRLSREDLNKLESDSIKNQRDLIHAYVASRPELRLVMEGYDDGYTGVNFDRPHFQEMVEAVKAGKINCVIVKDLSRFGREYIEGGRYLEKLFPSMGVRFIAISENIDTFHLDGASSLMMPFKNLINDAYCRDTSIKIRSHFDVKRRNGEFIGSFATYGYLKDPENKNKLVIDPDAAEVVRDIFSRRIDGQSNQAIADDLNRLGILSPMEYKRAKGMKFKSGYQTHSKTLWSAVAVRRILQNAVYLGVMEQGKRTTPNYKIKTVVYRAQEDWMRVENTHEPIVDQEDFDLVQRLLASDTRRAPGESAVYPLAGLLFCGDCFGTMSRRRCVDRGKEYIYYLCISNRDNKETCTPHRISEKNLDAAVLAGINLHLKAVVELRSALEAISRRPLHRMQVEKLDRRLASLRQELAKCQEVKDSLYRRYAMGELSSEDFEEFKRIFSADCEKVQQSIEAQQQELDDLLGSGSPDSPWIEYFRKFGEISQIDRKTAVRLIERILIYEGGRIEIIFRYQERFQAALNYLNLHKELDEVM